MSAHGERKRRLPAFLVVWLFSPLLEEGAGFAGFLAALAGFLAALAGSRPPRPPSGLGPRGATVSLNSALPSLSSRWTNPVHREVWAASSRMLMPAAHRFLSSRPSFVLRPRDSLTFGELSHVDLLGVRTGARATRVAIVTEMPK